MGHNNFRQAGLLLFVAVIAVSVGAIIGASVISGRYSGIIRNISAIRANDKLSSVISLVKSQYVDNVDMDSLSEEIIPVLLEKLDPHSVYIPASKLAGAVEPLEGQFDGIGITFGMTTDTVHVFTVISGGPSAKAGIQPGDRIITVADSLIAGRRMAQDEVVKMLRGPRGSRVDLGIMRAGVDGLLPIEVTRGVIPVRSIDVCFMVDSTTGYIQLARFSRNSHAEMVKAVTELKEQGMKNLIFDLRGNTGGYLEPAILIANEFLPEKSLIVYTEGRARKRIEQYSNGEGALQNIPLAILVNEESASSSEVLAGALQDNDRGTIIGRRTFGKGLVQEQIPYPDGSALRLTVARYYTPLGRLIQKPYDEGFESYNEDILRRVEHNELYTADSITFDDSLKVVTPGGKVLYGGGGIMPDIFVPYDTTGYNEYVYRVIRRNLDLKYSMEYNDAHRSELNTITTAGELKAYFEARPRLLEGFVEYAAANGVRPAPGQLEEGRARLEARLKGHIARSTPLEDNGLYLMHIPLDNEVKEAVKVLEETE